MVTELHFFSSKQTKGKEKKGRGLLVIKMVIIFIQSNQKSMQSSPQILLSVKIHKEQPDVFVKSEFSWIIVELMKKIFGAAYISSMNDGIRLMSNHKPKKSALISTS